jgi:dolichyl-phosphate beta-glucosyltransferase
MESRVPIVTSRWECEPGKGIALASVGRVEAAGKLVTDPSWGRWVKIGMGFDRRGLGLVGVGEMPASGAPFVSLVIPAYNEALRLEASVKALREYLGFAPWPHEVILVVERSTDGTLELARQLAAGQAEFHVIGNETQRGKGYAVRCGMLRARGDIAFFMDADLSTPLPEMDGFLAHFAAHPADEVLVGNRQHPHSAILKRQSLLRRKLGQGFNTVLRLVAGISLRDTQCGFKAFRRAAREALFSRQTLDGFAFDVELLLLAKGLGIRVVDLPVQWVNSEASQVSIVRDSIRMLRDAFRVRRIVRQTLGRETGQTVRSQ